VESEDGAMTLFKRHIGRRAAGIGVAAALLVLGLEAPAFAADPTIASFTPTSGPAGCVVTITGTNFDNPVVTDVEFNNTNAANFTVVSATQIRAEVDTGTTTGKIDVTNASNTATSTADFTIASPGTCAPTITSFTPTCGQAGTSVSITGTNLLDASDSAGTVTFNTTTAPSTAVVSATQITAFVPSGATTGKIKVDTGVGTAATSTADFTVGSCVTITSFTPTSGPVGTVVKITGTGFTGATAVSFNNVNATTFTVDSATQITATVPTGATTGKIKVTTPSGSGTSTADFVVSTVHSRSITLSLRKHLVARGMVSVGDAFTACAASVPVKIQRRVSGHWKTVGSTTTTSTGAYKKRIPDKPGRYRARATRVSLNSGADVCKRATSPVRRHTH
jgi:IPT/TIG domain